MEAVDILKQSHVSPVIVIIVCSHFRLSESPYAPFTCIWFGWVLGARQLRWASCLAFGGRVALAGWTTFLCLPNGDNSRDAW